MSQERNLNINNDIINHHSDNGNTSKIDYHSLKEFLNEKRIYPSLDNCIEMAHIINRYKEFFDDKEIFNLYKPSNIINRNIFYIHLNQVLVINLKGVAILYRKDGQIIGDIYSFSSNYLAENEFKFDDHGDLFRKASFMIEHFDCPILGDNYESTMYYAYCGSDKLKVAKVINDMIVDEIDMADNDKHLSYTEYKNQIVIPNNFYKYSMSYYIERAKLIFDEREKDINNRFIKRLGKK